MPHANRIFNLADSSYDGGCETGLKSRVRDALQPEVWAFWPLLLVIGLVVPSPANSSAFEGEGGFLDSD